MHLEFTNRLAELKELDTAAEAGGLLVVFGRRRMGKTPLLTHWLEPKGGLYSQAIEGIKEIQLEQVYQDIKGQFTESRTPRCDSGFACILLTAPAGLDMAWRRKLG